MDCLRDVIGVGRCEGTKPQIEVTQLPMITIKGLDSISDSDNDTFVYTIEAIRERAKQRILMDLYNKIGVQVTPSEGVFCLGRLIEPLALTLPSVLDRGVLFQVIQSAYLTLTIHNVMLRSPIAQDITIFVKDLVTSDILYTQLFSLTAGENTLQINTEVMPKRTQTKLLVGYADNIQLYDTLNMDCYDGCDCNCFECDLCNNIQGYPTNAGSSGTHGISVQYTFQCSLERFLCENIQVFRQALLYAFGIEYIYEAKGSERVNKYTQMNAEKAKDMLSYYESGYEKAINQALSGVNFCDNCCFDCTGGLQMRWSSL